jgi:hypothetical protein
MTPSEFVDNQRPGERADQRTVDKDKRYHLITTSPIVPDNIPGEMKLHEPEQNIVLNTW